MKIKKIRTTASRIDATDGTTTTTTTTTDKVLCIKCGCREIEISLRRYRNGYCETCFLSAATHKFKAALGKFKSTVCPNDSILLAHSGKANSTVLLHLVKTIANANESTSKRLRLRYKILYVDDGMAKGHTFEERELVREALAEQAEDLRLTMHLVSLSKCCSTTDDDLCRGIQSINAPRAGITEDDALLRETFDKLESDTARDELLRQLRRRLLVSAARKLDCNKIFVADTSLDLAIKVLGDASTGRGSQLFYNVGFSDTRCTDVTLLRPLRDFTGEDVLGYLQCYDLPSVFPFPTCSNRRSFSSSSFPASVRSIAEDFVRRLDTEFHGTVSTIYRTGEKMAKKTEEIDRSTSSIGTTNTVDDDDDSCILCELSSSSSSSSCYSREQRLSVVQARTFSKLVSTTATTTSTTTTTGCSSNVFLSPFNDVYDDEQQPSENVRMESSTDLDGQKCRCNGTDDRILSCSRSLLLRPEIIDGYFCYGCRSIFSNSNRTFSALPAFVLDKIYQRVQMTRLRREITDFLL